MLSASSAAKSVSWASTPHPGVAAAGFAGPWAEWGFPSSGGGCREAGSLDSAPGELGEAACRVQCRWAQRLTSVSAKEGFRRWLLRSGVSFQGP